MPSEKAKENKTLTSDCAMCGEAFSTELLRGRVVGTGRQRRIVPLCESCFEKPDEPAQATGETAASA